MISAKSLAQEKYLPARRDHLSRVSTHVRFRHQRHCFGCHSLHDEGRPREVANHIEAHVAVHVRDLFRRDAVQDSDC